MLRKRRRLILIIAAFVLMGIGLRAFDVVQRYDIGLLDYVKYSRSLTLDEQNYLRNNRLKYGIDTDDAPFAFVAGDTKESTGIFVDYFSQLSMVLGSELIPVEYDKFNLALKLKDGEIDCSILPENSTNSQVFLFTQPLYVERSKILVSGDAEYEDISDIKDLSIAVTSNSTAHHAANEYFAREPNVTIVLTEDLAESLELIERGEVDAVLGEEAKISYRLNQALKGNRYKFLDGSISEENVGIAINKDQERLHSILNKAILEMKKTQQDSHIYAKWFGSFIPEEGSGDEGGIPWNAWLVALVIIGLFTIWNLSVADRVEERTRELNRSREDLKGIIDSLAEGLMVTDEEGKVRLSNAVMNHLLNIDPKDVEGRLPEEIDSLLPYLERANGSEPFQVGEKYYLIYRRKMSAASESELIFIEDYTNRYKHERLNRQESKMIAVGELSAGLAHEIRNPLAIIKSYLYLLKKKVTGKEDEKAINVMDDSVRRINDLIENLLGFSRLSMEEAQTVDVRGSVESVIDLENKSLEKNGIDIDQKYRFQGSGRLKLNEDVLKLTLLNLINNSVDALSATEKEEKRIDIEVASENGELVIRFSDNGSGIPADKLEGIFDPFYTTKESGTGLGLYILDSEIRGIGGSISVDSKEGKGTTFTVRLPVEEEG